MPEKQASINCVFGKRGSGKTFLTQNVLLPRLPKPVFILDQLHDYSEGVIFTEFDGFLENIIDGKNKSKIYIFRPKNDIERDRFITLLKNIEIPCSIIFEEADLLCNPYKIDENIEYLIKYGRHFDINMVFISRRPAEINRLITSQSDFIITFNQTEKRDIDYLKNINSDAENVRKLDKNKHEFMILGDLTNDFKKINKNLACKFYLH